MTIAATQTTGSEIVLQERRVTNEYRIVQIREYILRQTVEVELELGPFETVNRGSEANPDIELESRGGSRTIRVWEQDEYVAIRDTWNNADLIAAVAAKMA